MAKGKAPASTAPKASKKTVAVTYRPLNTDDRTEIVWNKVKFLANVPVELDPNDKAHGYDVPMPKQYPGQNGETLTKHVETWVSMIDIAKDNPSFEVEGFPRARRKISTRKVPPPGAEWTEKNEGEISISDTIDTSVAA